MERRQEIRTSCDPVGARTPEELEMLLEDAFVIRDTSALAGLFEDGAVLAASLGEARGRDRIARLAEAMWERDCGYLADPARVIQTRGTALVVTRHGVNVVCRRNDGGWLYAISLFDRHTTVGGAP